MSSEFDNAFRLHRLGKAEAAFEAYNAILRRDPMHADALHYSGLLLAQAGQAERACQRLEQAARLTPQVPEIWLNLAQTRQTLNRLDAAADALQRALALAPAQAEIWSRLAGLDLRRLAYSEAEQAARRALALAPRHGQAWFNLALALQAQGQRAEARQAADTAHALMPQELSATGLLAQLEAELGDCGSARARLRTALAQQPQALPLLFQLAEIEEKDRQPVAAAEAYARILDLQADQGVALSQFLFLRKRLCDWRDLGLWQDRFRDGVARGLPMLTPFSFLSDPSTRQEQLACARRWSAQFPTRDLPPTAPLSDGRLNIAYLSSDFHQHATAVLTAGLFEAHDRTRFVVHAYSTGPDDGSALRARLVAGFDRFTDARTWPPARLAEQIRADGIDILIDLKGHTEGAPTAVLALRPAPIQVNYLGYPGSMGADFIDYLIGDPVVTPLEHQADYSEALALLPHCYQINDRQRPIAAETPSRAELGLPDEAVVFCCFNNSYKFNPEVFDAWARILKAVPGSVLWLLARGEDDPIIAKLRHEAAARGLAPERLVFAPFRANDAYLALYRQADLFLDTWPYNAHTTASDALWAGCPVLTWLGTSFAGRVAASLLHAVGLPELVVADVESYVRRAIALAGDTAARQRYRRHLASQGRASPLFDTGATTASLEAAYLIMAQQYRQGQRLGFSV